MTGIDLTRDDIDVARLPTERTGLAGRCAFQAGGALALPAGDGSFDAAVTPHVAMTVEDRTGFYREVARATRPGAPFGLFDVMEGPVGGLAYPMPWAGDVSTGFLRGAADTRDLLAAAGFDPMAETGPRERALGVFRAASISSSAPAPPGRSATTPPRSRPTGSIP